MDTSAKLHRWDPRTTYRHDDKLHLTHSSKHDSLSLTGSPRIQPTNSKGEDDHRRILLSVKDKSPTRGTPRGSLPRIATVDQLLRKHLLPGSADAMVIAQCEKDQEEKKLKKQKKHRKRDGIAVLHRRAKSKSKHYFLRSHSRLTAPTANSTRRRQQFLRSTKRNVGRQTSRKKSLRHKKRGNASPLPDSPPVPLEQLEKVTTPKATPQPESNTEVEPTLVSTGPQPRFLDTVPSGLSAATKQTDSELRSRKFRKARLLRLKMNKLKSSNAVKSDSVKRVFKNMRGMVKLSKHWFSSAKRGTEEMQTYYSGKSAQQEFYQKLRQFTLDNNRTCRSACQAKKAEKNMVGNLEADPVQRHDDLALPPSSVFSPRERFIAQCHKTAAIPESINVVRGNKHKADFSFRGTGDMTAWGNWKDVKHLNLSENRMTVRGVRLLLSRTGPSISELDVSGNDLGSEVCNDLLALLNADHQEHAVESIFKVKPKAPKKITSVKIKKLNPDEKFVKEEKKSESIHIPRSMAQLYGCHLAALNLAKTGIGDLGVITLAGGLKVNTTLKRLNVSNNKITDLGARTLHQALAMSGVLEELDVSWNSINDCSVDFMGLLAMKCLNLSWNTFRGKDHSIAKRLAVELRDNVNLLVLDISSTNLDEEDTRLIAEGLEYNHVLLEINLHGNRGHTETDVLGFMYEPPPYLNKRGISLLQRSIETAERSRIKWLSLPNVLNRYMFTEHDPHSERDQKSESDRKAVMSVHNQKWISGGWDQISIKLDMFDDFVVRDVKDLQADLQVTVHLLSDNFKAWPMEFEAMKSQYKLRRVLPPGRQYVFFTVYGPSDVNHVYTSQYGWGKVSKETMRKYPSVDWELHREKVMNYIEIQPRMYCDLKITTAPIRPGKNWVPPPVKPDWTLEGSIFAPRKKNHELHTFLEYDHFDERFEKDWELMAVTFNPDHVATERKRGPDERFEKVKIVDPMVPELPCTKEELELIKTNLKEYYQIIRDVCRNFAGRYMTGDTGAGVNALSHRGFVAMLQNGGIIKHTSKDDHTIGHFDLKTFDTMFSLVSQQMLPHTFVLRFEFMKLLIFIAHHKFVVSHVVSSLPNAIGLLLSRHIVYSFGDVEFVDDFRKDMLYTKKCSKALRRSQNVLGKLHRLYGRGHGGTTGGNRITIKEWVQLCNDAEDMSTKVREKAKSNFGVKLDPAQTHINRSDMNTIFVMSTLDVLDQTQNNNYRSLSWVDFLEAVCRLARRQFFIDRALEVQRRADVDKYLGRSEEEAKDVHPPIENLTLTTFLDSLNELIADKLLPLAKRWSMGLTPVFGVGKIATTGQVTMER